MTEKYSSILFLHDSPRDGLLRKTGQGTVLCPKVIVFGCIDVPEVHIPGYGHYHEGKHAFHIWYGSKITK